MPKNIGLSMSGARNQTYFNICGYTNTNSQSLSQNIPTEVKKIKIQILNCYIIPFMSKNWKVLEENFVFFYVIISKLTSFNTRYPNLNLKIYIDLLYSFETAVFLNIENTNLEEKLYGKECNMSTILFKTVMLRIKPEYEIYNLIFGKPNFKCEESYNTNILNDILTLLHTDNVTFIQIKTNISNKYLNAENV
jgi:hypothetical protein